MIDGLSEQLGLIAPERAAAARQLAERLKKERDDLEKQQDKLKEKLDKTRSRIRSAVTANWPELTNAWDPKATVAWQREPEQLIAIVETHPDFSDFETQERDLDAIRDRRFDLERTWVKCQRLVRTLENVALAANLPHLADSATQERYRQLLAAEAGTLGRQP